MRYDFSNLPIAPHSVKVKILVQFSGTVDETLAEDFTM